MHNSSFNNFHRPAVALLLGSPDSNGDWHNLMAEVVASYVIARECRSELKTLLQVEYHDDVLGEFRQLLGGVSWQAGSAVLDKDVFVRVMCSRNGTKEVEKKLGDISCASGMVHCQWHSVHFEDGGARFMRLYDRMAVGLVPLSESFVSLSQILGAARTSFAVWSGRARNVLEHFEQLPQARFDAIDGAAAYIKTTRVHAEVARRRSRGTARRRAAGRTQSS